MDIAASEGGSEAAPASLEEAIRHHLAHRYDEAEAMYRRVIAQQPAAGAPRHWLGFMLQQRDRLAEAHALIAESLRLDPSQADRHFNFGILATRMGRIEEAQQAFLNAISLDPRNSYFSWTNLGSLYEKSGDPEKAEQSYLAATVLDADCPDAFYLLSSLCVDQRRFTEAKRYHCLGFVAGPAAGKPRIKLSMAYYELGRADEAIALIDAWLAEQPDDPEAQHLAIAYKGLPAPERCSEAYVETTYDGFAASFEATLTKLKYAGPQALAEELREAGFAPGSLETLELGCGTGFNADALKSVSSILTGVDLSRRMLEQASLKAVYDRLIKAEICEFLRESAQRYDLIACMDTLIYFGALDEIVQLMAGNLKPGGALILTTERLEEKTASSSSHLNISGRYSHSESYLRGLLEANGLELMRIRDLTLRMEAGMPIPGQILRARKRLARQD